MTRTLDRVAWESMLTRAGELVEANVERLSQLDSFAGDGDHGTTMRRAMAAVAKVVADTPGEAPALLEAVGWALLGIDGGATGPLLGMFFTGLAGAATPAMDALATAAAFTAGLAAVQRQTKARVGDKTLIDALQPAVEALSAAAEAGEDVAGAMARAAAAAEVGAAATATLQAKFGRARNLGERSIGQPDAGATSVSLLCRGFAEALAAGE